MKKIFYFIAAVGLAWGIVSCDNEPKNPGDFSIKSTLSLGSIKSNVTGEVYKLTEVRNFDTIFKTPVQVWDTVWNAAGEFESRTADTIWVPAKFTTNFIEMEPIMLPVYADTFAIDIYSNAKWLSPQPTRPKGGSEIFNDATNMGGGDGTLIFRTILNENATRKITTDIIIYTSDSTVMYKLPFLQEGMD